MGLLDGVGVSSQERQETKKPKSRPFLPPPGSNAQNPFQKIWFLTGDNTHDDTFSRRFRRKKNLVVFLIFFSHAVSAAGCRIKRSASFEV